MKSPSAHTRTEPGQSSRWIGGPYQPRPIWLNCSTRSAPNQRSSLPEWTDFILGEADVGCDIVGVVLGEHIRPDRVDLHEQHPLGAARLGGDEVAVDRARPSACP